MGQEVLLLILLVSLVQLQAVQKHIQIQQKTSYSQQIQIQDQQLHGRDVTQSLEITVQSICDEITKK